MPQFNLHLTPEFEKNLQFYMKKKGLTQKSEALRLALEDAVGLLKAQKKSTDFGNWLGMGLQIPINPNIKPLNEDDLWE